MGDMGSQHPLIDCLRAAVQVDVMTIGSENTHIFYVLGPTGRRPTNGDEINGIVRFAALAGHNQIRGWPKIGFARAERLRLPVDGVVKGALRIGDSSTGQRQLRS